MSTKAADRTQTQAYQRLADEVHALGITVYKVQMELDVLLNAECERHLTTDEQIIMDHLRRERERLRQEESRLLQELWRITGYTA